MGAEWRESYQNRWDIYDIFSRREDFPDAAWNTVRKHIDFSGKTVFEMGCGTGKYTNKIAELAEHLYANDISEMMIERARTNCSNHSNITYICASAETSGLPDASVDIIFSAWGYVAGNTEIAGRVEREFARILRPGGEVWLLDNYYEGEFTKIRGKELIDGADKYAEKRFGYSLVDTISTYFLFDSIDEAASVFGFLFGDKAKNTIINNQVTKIEDYIALMKKTY